MIPSILAVFDPVTGDLMGIEFRSGGYIDHFYAVDQKLWPGFRLGRFPNPASDPTPWLKERIIRSPTVELTA